MGRRRRRQRQRNEVERDLEYASGLKAEAQERAQQRKMKALLSEQTSAMAKRQLFVTNLRFEVRAPEVKKFFEAEFGPVASVRILQKSQQSSGKAIVEFEHESSMAWVIGTSTICSLSLGHRTKLNVRPHQATGRSYRNAGSSHFIAVEQLDCGCLLPPAAGQAQQSFISEWQSNSSSNSACFNLESRTLEMNVMGPAHRLFVLQARFKSIRSMALTQAGSLLVTLKLPPKVLRVAAAQQPDAVQAVQADPARSSGCSSTFQLQDSVRDAFRDMVSSLLSSLAHAADAGFVWPPELDGGLDGSQLACTTDFTPCGTIGRCLTYALRLPGGSRASRMPDIAALLRVLRDFGLLRGAEQPPLLVQARSKEQVLGRIQELEALTCLLPLDLAYLLHCMLSSSLVSIWSDVRGLCGVVQAECRQQHAGVHAALLAMAHAQYPHPDPVARLRQLLGSSPSGNGVDDDEDDTPGHCMLVPWALVTPTRVRWMPPRPEMSNRVLRHAAQQHGFTALDVMRVCFGEEHGGMVYLMDDKAGDIAHRLARTMLEGLRLLGRQLSFLAYSSSQLKERSYWAAYMQHPNPELRPDRLRAWMGSFDHIRIPAKYAARMGQCFSTTASADAVLPQHACRIPDVERGGYTFSDGVGQISPDLLLATVKQLPFAPADPHDVSAIQVRFSGCKGVLASHPPLPAGTLCVRPSMTKFSSPHSVLEVCSIAAPIPCFLNRHVILLLLHKGVPPAVFLTMQDEMDASLNRMLRSRTHATSLLPRLGCVSNACSSMLLTMLRGGMEPTTPFIQSCLAAARVHLLVALRKKARLLVDQGVVLMGIMDETATLPPETVFLQVKDPASGEWRVHTGSVLVAKHPVMHPGDVRMLRAVDAPALHHLKHTLVFSQLGPRPLPNMLSGSDLDGDQYAVVWDPSLCFFSPNSTPGSYQAAPPVEVDRVQVPDLVRHFIDHARSDMLGQIANCWLVCADSAGADCPECLELAGMHSTAVDFPKTGVPAPQLSPRLWKAVEAYPHWMENKRRASYHSSGALGQMYDRLVGVESELPAPLGSPCQGFDSGFVVPGWEVYEKEAGEDRRWYEGRLVQLMNQHSVHCEGELLTGCILRYNKMQRRRQNDVREQLKQRVGQLCHDVRHGALRTLFAEVWEVRGTRGEEAEEMERWLDEQTPAKVQEALQADEQAKQELWKKASAYYHVTYHPQVAAAYSIPDFPLHSFCWVAAAEVLMDIKRRWQ